MNAELPESDRGSSGASGNASTVLWVLVVAGVVLLALAAAALSYKNLLPGMGEPAVATQTMATSEAPQNPELPPVEALDQAGIGRLLASVSDEQRGQLLGDAETFKGFVTQEVARRAVLRAARESGVEANARVVYLMQRGGEQILLEAFMSAALNGRVSPDFPSEAQLQKTYEANLERFRVEDQIPIWQVFVALPEGAGEAEVNAASQSASEIANEIRSGVLSFAQAATRYSAHEASRANEGFMGVVRPSQLVPAVRERVSALAQDQVSDPIAGESGFHIVRRGAINPGRVVPLDEVRAKLVQELRRTAVAQLRQAVVRESVSRFGGAAPADPAIEQWRVALGAGASQSPSNSANSANANAGQ